MTRTLLLFGAGPGIGNNVAATFASKGAIDHVVLLGRNTDRLQNEDAPFVLNAAPNVKADTLRADLSDLDSLPSVLSQLDNLTRDSAVEVVYYNAARIKPSDPVLSVDVKEIEEDFRLQVLALHLVAQHYLPQLQQHPPAESNFKPALLVTNSHLPWDPVPQLISLSLVKGAQRTQMLSLNRAFSDTRVHCALVTVEGQVGPDNKVLSPRNIADEAFKLWQRSEGVEVNLKEPGQ
ncbi:uncharacterized protein EKO05_0002976 [Ascochyta rabiei]|uniref:Oxidoreductase n=1 Tax=Didymella rabiei TaxID=5454 RepID=A0A162X2V9_DIDRA|nr:uncharacterized protein EKO05_0002976 [Ascochyta rabiei]KZM19324.1 oxidoreductase [Ascochyta rabiei]UPX12428.1 hypothetical protein EKO05_0002976 [Ascochyta rabiei]